MKLGLNYDMFPRNAFLTIYGEYLEDSEKGLEVRKAILAAGWLPEKYPASKVPATTEIPEWLETESYFQPKGTALFNGQTPKEGRTNLSKLRTELRKLGIVLGKPSKRSFCEQL